MYYFFGPNGYSDVYMNEKWLKWQVRRTHLALEGGVVLEGHRVDVEGEITWNKIHLLVSEHRSHHWVSLRAREPCTIHDLLIPSHIYRLLMDHTSQPIPSTMTVIGSLSHVLLFCQRCLTFPKFCLPAWRLGWFLVAWRGKEKEKSTQPYFQWKHSGERE